MLLCISVFPTHSYAEISTLGCDWNSWFEYPNCGSKYDHDSDVYVKVKPNKYQDIDYMKLYVDGQYVRKESNYPYEWCKSNSSDDHRLRNMKPGKYKLKIEIKDRCGDTHYKYCEFEVKDHNNSGGQNHCDWDSWFEYPSFGNQYDYHSDCYVKVKPNKYQDIEYMKLYLDGQYVRKESNYPYEWCKPNSSEDQKLRKMKNGKYKLKVVIRDRCGHDHEKYCEFEVKHENGNTGGGYTQCKWKSIFEYPNHGDQYDYHSHVYVKVKPEKYQDVEYMKLYIDGQYVRKESNYPYEWCKSASSDDQKLRDMEPGNYKLKVEIKDRCGDTHYEECNFVVKQGSGGGNNNTSNCEWDSWFEYPSNGNQYDHHSDCYVKVKPKKYQDIEYMKLYLNGHYIRKESNYPYEWCKSTSTEDQKLRKMEPGNYKLKVEIRDRCGYTHEKECNFVVKHGSGGSNTNTSNCDWDYYFDYPKQGQKYDYNSDVYVKVKTEKYQDIEYMKLYLDGQYIRKESNTPYEWCKSSGSDDTKLRKMKPGKYKLKCEVKDRCGQTHEKYCDFEIKSSAGYGGQVANNCDWNCDYNYPKHGQKYNKHSDVYVKITPKKYQDIEYMKLYLDGQYIRKESSHPYEWCKNNSSGDSKLRHMSPGKYKLKVEIRDKCGKTNYEYREFEVKS